MLESQFDWFRFRNERGDIDLIGVYDSLWPPIPTEAESFLGSIMRMQPVRSRQTAALAVYTARAIVHSTVMRDTLAKRISPGGE